MPRVQVLPHLHHPRRLPTSQLNRSHSRNLKTKLHPNLNHRTTLQSETPRLILLRSTKSPAKTLCLPNLKSTPSKVTCNKPHNRSLSNDHLLSNVQHLISSTALLRKSQHRLLGSTLRSHLIINHLINTYSHAEHRSHQAPLHPYHLTCPTPLVNRLRPPSRAFLTSVVKTLRAPT